MVSYGYKGRIYGSIAETQFLHFFDIFGSEKQKTVPLAPWDSVDAPNPA